MVLSVGKNRGGCPLLKYQARYHSFADACYRNCSFSVLPNFTNNNNNNTHKLGLNKPVSALSYSLFKGLPNLVVHLVCNSALFLAFCCCSFLLHVLRSSLNVTKIILANYSYWKNMFTDQLLQLHLLHNFGSVAKSPDQISLS